jgi:c(7)-type cytochrome triheme protein
LKSRILFFTLGVAVCGPALAAQEQQQQAPAMTAHSAMPTSDISRFSHDFHVNKVGFCCADCHNSLFQQASGSAKAAGDFTMSAFDQGKYCGTCHDGNTAFATEKDNCARCHGSNMKPPQTIVFEQPVKTVVFDHSKHTEVFGIACSKCHESLFKMKKGESEKQPDFKMDSIYQGKYCGACHNGSSAFNAKTRCTLCHIGKQGLERMSSKEQQPEVGHSSN